MSDVTLQNSSAGVREQEGTERTSPIGDGGCSLLSNDRPVHLRHRPVRSKHVHRETLHAQFKGQTRHLFISHRSLGISYGGIQKCRGCPVRIVPASSEVPGNHLSRGEKIESKKHEANVPCDHLLCLRPHGVEHLVVKVEGSGFGVWG